MNIKKGAFIVSSHENNEKQNQSFYILINKKWRQQVNAYVSHRLSEKYSPLQPTHVVERVEGSYDKTWGLSPGYFLRGLYSGRGQTSLTDCIKQWSWGQPGTQRFLNNINNIKIVRNFKCRYE